MNLIAFIGWQTSGKTTAAKILEAHYGWSRTRFAGPLRDMLRAVGLGNEELDGSLKNKPCDLLFGKTPVQAMQILGVDFGRAIHEDFWVRLWESNVHSILDEGGKVCVDDLRFPNEAAAILDMGGTIVRIKRPGINRGSDHVSEAFTDKITPHFEIINKGSLAALEGELQEILL